MNNGSRNPGSSPDIAIDEVRTNLEITDTAGSGAGMSRDEIIALIRQCLREERHKADLRDQDTRITDRAWRPNRMQE